MEDGTRDAVGKDARRNKLRALAEKKVKQRVAAQKQSAKGNADKLLHELQVNQIELEARNAELLAAQDELKASQEELGQSQQKYAEFFESAPTGYLILDGEAKIVELNHTAADILGWPERKLKKHSLSMCVERENLAVFMAHAKTVLKDGQRDECELKIVKADGTTAYTHLISEPAKCEKGKVIECRTSLVDISQRRKREEELHKLNRTLKALSASSQAMMRWQEDEQAYLDAVCRIIVEDCGHKMVWIGYAEDDKAKSVRPVAYSGFEEGYLETLSASQLTWADTERGRGPTGTAIRSGKVSMCENMLTDPKFKPWRKEAIKRGYASSIVLPLKNVYKIFGALNIYSKEPNPFSKDEVNLLTELADDLAYGITTMKLHAAHTKAEQSLRESEQRIQMAMQLSRSFAFEWEPATDRVLRSENCGTILGLSGDEMENDTGQRYFQRVHPDDRERFVRMLGELKPTVDTYQTQYRILRSDGTTVVLEEAARGFFDAKGKLRRLIGITIDITERKRVEEAISRNQKTFLELVERSPFGIYIVDSQFRIAQMNVNAQNGAFRNVRPVIGRPFSEAMHILWPDDVAEDIIAHFHHTLDTGEPYYAPPFFNPRQDLEIVEGYEWELHRITLADGHYGVICYYFDSTKLRQAEEAVRERERLLQDVIDGSPSPIFLKDRDGKFITINASLERMLGKSREEIKGKTDYDIAPKEVADYWRSNDIKVMTTGKAIQIEETADLLDGHHVFLANKFPLVNANGQVYGVGGISHDITDRKQVEEALANERENLQTIFDTVDVGMLLVDEQGEVKRVNNTVIRWINKDPAAVFSGQPGDILGCIHALESPEGCGRGDECSKCLIRSAFQSALQSGKAVHDVEAEAILSLGGNKARLWLEASADIVFLDGKRHVILTLNNIGARKEAEAALRASELRERQRAEELERLGGELKHKNEELESIIRIASHDLRSPLMNIKGFSGELAKDLGKTQEMLKEVQLPEETREKTSKIFGKYVPEAIGFIQASADSINRMLKSLMDVAKAGTVPVHIADVDMNALLAKVQTNTQFRLKESGGQIEVEPLPQCRADWDQMTQVFTNLVENAIKYCEPSRPLRIQVYAKAEADKVTYCVEDNGKGIAPEHHDKVFNLFTRLEPEAAKGEGIGLTIVKRMIERQGGKIWVRSEAGKGSKFFVTLPSV